MGNSWSKFQQDYFSQLEFGEGSTFLHAVAGSGKTTAIAEGAKRLVANGDRIVALSFGKQSAMDLGERMPSQVTSSTINSLGWKICRDNIKGIRFAKGKISYLFKQADNPRANYGQTIKLISLAKANLVSDMVHLNDRYAIDASDETLELASSLLIKSSQNTKYADFDDQTYFPIFHQMQFPSWFDKVFVDEAQDLTPAQIRFVDMLNCRDQHAVGDEFQAIYGFRGADTDAAQRIMRQFECKEMPLSICYRCPQDVVRLAQEYVPHILPWEHAPVGTVDTDVNVNYIRKNATVGDLILCRTNAPLIRECLQFVKNDKPAYVKGKEVCDAIVNVVESLDCRKVDDLFVKLEDWLAEQQEKYANRPEVLAMRVDYYEVIKLVGAETVYVSELFQKLNLLFTYETGEVITLMTVHKAKGLQAKNVFVLDFDKMPHKSAVTAEQKQQEINLIYVAITRAQQSLFLAGSDEKY